MAEGTKTRFTAEQVASAAKGRPSLESWREAGFFAPLPPPAPVAQEEVKGRQYDYGTGFNMLATPRAEERGNTSFGELRALADGYDLLRLVIETRKDQLAGLEWNIVGRNEDDKVEDDDKRVQEIQKFLRRPDGNLTWDDWLRMVVEDLLVIDAPCVYPRKTLGGDMFALEVIDGATIKVLIDDTGRTPLEGPAYAQIIKGMQATHYTREELIYKPRNRRSWKQYGYSPVEQILMTVNIALRRQVSQLQYYTEGNIPEAMASCPPEWTPDQVTQMQAYWDTMIGQSDIKRHMRFIPGGVDMKFTREPTLKDTFDEWLARIVAYAFSVSPQALIQMMNRATAESAAESAQLEGLAPLQTWVKNLVNDIIENHFGYDDLVFEWDSGEELDPKAQAEIHKIYIDAGVLDVEEVRTDIGRDQRAGMSGTASGQANPQAQELLTAAIGLHEKHMNGSAPTTGPDGEKSQTTMMQQMQGALAAMTSGASPVPSDMQGMGDGKAPLAGGAAGVPAAAGDAPDSTLPPQLGPDGLPVPLASDAAGGVPAGGASTVQDLAMNGTQVSGLVDIVTMCAAKELPPETARAIIAAAFPAIRTELVDQMLNSLKNFEPAKPAAPVDAQGNPIQPPGAPKVAGEGVVVADDKAKPTGKAEGAAGGAVDAKAKKEVPAPKVEKLHKAHAHGKVKVIAKHRKALAGALRTTLFSICEDVCAQVEAMPDTVQKSLAKAKDKDASAKRILNKFNISFDGIEEQLLSSLEVVSTTAAASAVKSLGDAVVNDALSLANTRAEKWASGHSADLIKDLTASTRDMLRSSVVLAEQEGWTNAELAKELRNNYAFSKQRAETVARTELKAADSEGAIAGWRATGLKMQKEWLRSQNDNDCDVCAENEAQGPIALDDSFESGDDTSPAHPNCECVVTPVINDEDQ